MEQFLRTELLLGKEKFRKLHGCAVSVAGLGAVGSFALEALARAGVGKLRIIDFDVIHETNINRQLYALHSTLRQAKVEAAQKRIRDINPRCQVEPLNIFVAEDTLDVVLTPKPDVLIDAIDSVNPKTQLLCAAATRGVRVISSMGASCRTDPFALRVGDLFDTCGCGCPLARKVRSRLKRRGVTRGVTCVYSTEQCVDALADPDAAMEKRTIDRGRERRVIGSLPTIPALFGIIIAHQAIEWLVGGFSKKA